MSRIERLSSLIDKQKLVGVQQGVTKVDDRRRLRRTIAIGHAGGKCRGIGRGLAGKRSGLYRPDVQRRLTAALGATPEELLSRRVGHAAPGMASEGRAFVHAPATPVRTETRRLQLSNDDLAPWAASGVVVEYEPGRWPRRDQGCVIEMADGEVRVRLYEGADAGALTVRGGPGGLESRQRIARADTRSVSAVVARLEF